MISKLKAVLDDDRGVSPVIGVILMVAITVILAAVIGTFVLGLGDSLEQAPQAQLDAESNTDGDLLISHNGGDAIAAGEIRITVEDADNTPYDDTTFSFVGDGDGEFNVGDTIELTSSEISGASGDTQVQVIHTPSESIILDTEVSL